MTLVPHSISLPVACSNHNPGLREDYVGFRVGRTIL